MNVIKIAKLIQLYFLKQNYWPEYEQKHTLSIEEKRALYGSIRLCVLLWGKIKRSFPKQAVKSSMELSCCVLVVLLQEKILHHKKNFYLSGVLKTALSKLNQAWFFKQAYSLLQQDFALEALFDEELIASNEDSLLRLCMKQHPSLTIDAFFSHPKVWMRVEKDLSLLQEVDYQESPIKNAVCFQKSTSELSSLFEQGAISYQDISAQALVLVLDSLSANPNNILDCCCAPGGKASLMMNTWPNASYLLTDISEKRLEGLKSNLERINKTGKNIVIQEHDWSAQALPENKKFDLILVDTVCSGLGVVKRHPDVLWNKDLQSIASLQSQQKQILKNAISCLSQKGQLIYCTCSVLQEENDDIINSILKENPHLKTSPLSLPFGFATKTGWQILPTADQDGLFYCVIKATD